MSSTETGAVANNDIPAGHERTVPTELDVMCGTGQEKHHPGNKLFQLAVTPYVDTYANAKSKSEKIKITKAIMDLLNEKGVRFLKKSSVYQIWYVADQKVGRDKIGHFLRLCLSKKRMMPANEVGATVLTNDNQDCEMNVSFLSSSSPLSLSLMHGSKPPPQPLAAAPGRGSPPITQRFRSNSVPDVSRDSCENSLTSTVPTSNNAKNQKQLGVDKTVLRLLRAACFRPNRRNPPASLSFSSGCLNSRADLTVPPSSTAVSSDGVTRADSRIEALRMDGNASGTTCIANGLKEKSCIQSRNQQQKTNALPIRMPSGGYEASDFPIERSTASDDSLGTFDVSAGSSLSTCNNIDWHGLSGSSSSGNSNTKKDTSVLNKDSDVAVLLDADQAIRARSSTPDTMEGVVEEELFKESDLAMRLD